MTTTPFWLACRLGRAFRALMLAVAAAASCGVPAVAYEAGDLPKVEAWVRQGYADVAHLTAEDLARRLASGEQVVLFDVREPEEFAVSHITNAIRVDPSVWSWPFLRQHAASSKGKTVVFYCSVGVRSSKLAGRVQNALLEAGAVGVYNLQGGIFRWHNERRGLVDAAGDTQRVHPYDSDWGRLVERQDLVAAEPRPLQVPVPVR